MTYTPNRSITHCAFCGASYGQLIGWPRDCPSCSETVWRNPLPVAVTLFPIRSAGKTALLVARRTIEPSRGELSLPGGYMELGETWQEAAVRELREETEIVVAPDQIVLFDVVTGYDTVQTYGRLPEYDAASLPPSVPTPESEGWSLLFRSNVDLLAFPAQREMASVFFSTFSD